MMVIYVPVKFEFDWTNSVDSRNFEMWGQFPPMSETCGQ